MVFHLFHHKRLTINEIKLKLTEHKAKTYVQYVRYYRDKS